MGLPFDKMAKIEEAFNDLIAKHPEVAGQLIALGSNVKELVEQLTGQIKEVKDLASTDILTGLLNRRGWETAMAAVEKYAETNDTDAAVMIFDLDELKEVNDSKGHAAGDELLRRMADVLVQLGRKKDYIARIGGDEFSIVIRECESQDTLDLIVGRLVRSFADSHIRVSVGTCLRSDAGSMTQAAATADARMYKQKRSKQEA